MTPLKTGVLEMADDLQQPLLYRRYPAFRLMRVWSQAQLTSNLAVGGIAGRENRARFATFTALENLNMEGKSHGIFG
jgi:hypothetical protein